MPKFFKWWFNDQFLGIFLDGYVFFISGFVVTLYLCSNEILDKQQHTPSSSCSLDRIKEYSGSSSVEAIYKLSNESAIYLSKRLCISRCKTLATVPIPGCFSISRSYSIMIGTTAEREV